MGVILADVCLGLLTIALLIAGIHFKIQSIVYFLIIGILAGPYAHSILTDQTTIETKGEIGDILLIFAIGLELSFDKLIGFWRIVILVGFLQVVTTIFVASWLIYIARGSSLLKLSSSGF